MRLWINSRRITRELQEWTRKKFTSFKRWGKWENDNTVGNICVLRNASCHISLETNLWQISQNSWTSRNSGIECPTKRWPSSLWAVPLKLNFVQCTAKRQWRWRVVIFDTGQINVWADRSNGDRRAARPFVLSAWASWSVSSGLTDFPVPSRTSVVVLPKISAATRSEEPCNDRASNSSSLAYYKYYQLRSPQKQLPKRGIVDFHVRELADEGWVRWPRQRRYFRQ